MDETSLWSFDSPPTTMGGMLEANIDLEELPEETRKELSFFLVDSIGEVFDVAFGDGAKVRPKAAPSPERQAALGR